MRYIQANASIKCGSDSKKRAKRRVPCKVPCTCCFACGTCSYKVVTKQSLTKHLKDKGHSKAPPPPSSSSSSAALQPSENEDEKSDPEIPTTKENDDDAPLYCICQREYEEEMTQNCDHCDDWYHPVCLLESEGIMVFQHDAGLEFFCHKAKCREATIDVEEWGGTVVNHRVDTDPKTNEGLPVLYEIEWADGSANIWAQESEIPNSCLDAYRLKLDTKRRKSKRKTKTPIKQVASPEAKPRKPLPKRIVGKIDAADDVKVGVRKSSRRSRSPTMDDFLY